MSVTTTFDFTTAGDIVASNTSIVSGNVKLAQQATSHTFTEAFSSATGFTYDSAKAEFTGGQVRQKDIYPGETFFADFSANQNASYGNGSLTGTLTGAATWSSGKVNFAGGATANKLDFSAVSNAQATQTGAIRLRVTPNYSGTPSGNQPLVGIFKDGALQNHIAVWHTASGDIQLFLRDSAATSIITYVAGTWSPVAGTEYEFELNWDVTVGATRIFIDGVQKGTTQTNTFTRTTDVDVMRFGTNYNNTITGANFKINDVSIFNTVQHTANYTPTTHTATRYVSSNVELPTFTYSYLNYLSSLSNITTSESGVPHYGIRINGGAVQFWAGSWATSDQTYAQGNTAAELIANIGSLTLTNVSSIKIVIMFPDTNTQAAVSNFTIDYGATEYYSTGYAVTSTSFTAQSITTLSAVETDNSQTIRYAWRVNGGDKYWNGSAWVTSNLTTAQGSTLAQMAANSSSLLSVNSTINLVVILGTTSGIVSPLVDSATATYSFGAIEPDEPLTCLIYGYLSDLSNSPISGATVSVRLSEDSAEYREAGNHVLSNTASTTTDANGYWVLSLVRSSELEGTGYYGITFFKSGVMNITNNNGQTIQFSVPDAVSADFADQIVDV